MWMGLTEYVGDHPRNRSSWDTLLRKTIMKLRKVVLITFTLSLVWGPGSLRADDQGAGQDLLILSSINDAETSVLTSEEMEGIRGEKWEYGVYIRGVAEFEPSGIRVGGEYRYNITDRSGKSVLSLTLPVPSIKVLGQTLLPGVATAGEAVSFTLRGAIPVYGAVVADLGTEGGKYTSGPRKGNYYLEFIGGVGAGKPGVSVGAKINGVQIKFASGTSATVGLWARSYGSKTEIAGDLLKVALSSAGRQAIRTALPLL
jgi:hypothetical protein